LKLLSHLDGGMHLANQFAFVETFEACGIRDVVKHCLHQGAGHRRAAVHGGDRFAMFILDRAKTRIAMYARIELVSLVFVLMHAMQYLALYERGERDMEFVRGSRCARSLAMGNPLNLVHRRFDHPLGCRCQQILGPLSS
jgi:hypothetical protein